MIRNMFKKSEFVRIAFVACVGFPLFIATSASAQNPSPAPSGEATTERVVVTGSLIPTAEEVTANPVDTLTSADIQRSGEATDILQVLEKRDPDFIGVGNLGQTNANIASGNGSSSIQIRGLPTLVLFEGRRFATNATVALGAGEFSDVSIFPTRLVSRLEVLKDGASSAYGSDAVGGVVNIFLKDNFQGFELGYRYGSTLESSTVQRQGWVIAGAGNDTTQVTAAIQYVEQDPLFMRERFYSRLPLGGVTTTFGGSGRDATGRFLIDSLVPANWPAGSKYNSPNDFVASGSIIIPNVGNANGYQQLSAINPGQGPLYRPGVAVDPADGLPNEILAYDLSLRPTSTLDESSSTAYASFDHKICGDQLEAFGNFLFAHNHSENDLNAQPLSNATGVIILGSKRVDPNDPTAGDALGGTIIPEDRGNPAVYNPFDLSQDLSTAGGSHRLLTANRYTDNPRRFTNDNDFYRFLGGLKSQITDSNHGNWYTEGAAYYSNYQLTFVNENLVNAAQLNGMIAGTALDNAGAAIPSFDFFALHPVGTNPGQITQAQFGTIFGDTIREISTYNRSFDWMIRGEPFNLPAGPVGVAGGVQYYAEGFKYQDSLETFVGSVPTPASNHGRNVFGAFMEANFPIVGSQQNIPFIYSLSLDLAGRYDSYEGITATSKTPKVMMRYQPIKDVTLRGTFSTSFIAPDLFSLYGPTGTGFTPAVTLNGEVQDQAQLKVLTNPTLAPSTAQSWTGGIVYSPHFVPGLTVSADYFWTLQQGIVAALPSQLIIIDVENRGSISPFYNLIAFNNYPGSSGALPITGPGPNNSHGLAGNLVSAFVTTTVLNIGADRVEGWDMNIDYNWNVPRFGDMDWGVLEAQVRSVVFTRHDRKYFPSNFGASYFNVSGLIGDEGFGAFPDYKISFLLEHRVRNLTLTLTANYLPEMKNIVGSDPFLIQYGLDPAFPTQGALPSVGDYITVDGRLSYTFHKTAAEAPVTEPKDGKAVLDGKAVAGAAPTSCWNLQNWLDNTTLAVGCNNMLDEDPRIVSGGNSSTNLSTYDPFGRFVYFEIDKKF